MAATGFYGIFCDPDPLDPQTADSLGEQEGTRGTRKCVLLTAAAALLLRDPEQPPSRQQVQAVGAELREHFLAATREASQALRPPQPWSARCNAQVLNGFVGASASS